MGLVPCNELTFCNYACWCCCYASNLVQPGLDSLSVSRSGWSLLRPPSQGSRLCWCQEEGRLWSLAWSPRLLALCPQTSQLEYLPMTERHSQSYRYHSWSRRSQSSPRCIWLRHSCQWKCEWGHVLWRTQGSLCHVGSASSESLGGWTKAWGQVKQKALQVHLYTEGGGYLVRTECDN